MRVANKDVKSGPVFIIIFLIFVLQFLSFFHITFGHETSDFSNHDYCIIGAGPAGLQMGYFLQQTGRSYVIFEKSDKPGNFFERFPRHRKLISINKRHTGRSNQEFNLRHDWNSLLTTDYSHLFTNYSKLYFPLADTLLIYLKDFTQKFGLNVVYKTEIKNIEYHDTAGKDHCLYSMHNHNNEQYCCGSLFVATGLSKPVFPKFEGSEYAESYDTASIDPAEFEGKSVMIVGRGNSGLELASSIYGSTNYVHLVGRNRLRFSWDTHYVGDARAVNNDIVDAYMLKSLDGFLEFDVRNMHVTKRDSDGKLMVTLYSSRTGRKFDPESLPTRHGYDRIIACTGFQWDPSIFGRNMQMKLSEGSTFPTVPPNKYPNISYDYQSPDYQGLYFIGVLAHSLDFKKSAGGFIHGFRYTVRALHRLLEWQNHGVKWPHIEFGLEHLVTQILKRANEASGIYQMFGHLGDVAIVDRNTDNFVYVDEFPIHLLHAFPENSGINFDPDRHSLFILTLEYGKNFSSPNFDRFGHTRAVVNVTKAHLSNFLHPVIYFFENRLPAIVVDKDPGEGEAPDCVPGADAVHHILEDFTTTFDLPLVHRAPLRRFVESKINRNLKTYTADSCAAKILADCQNVPPACRRYLDTEQSILSHYAADST